MVYANAMYGAIYWLSQIVCVMMDDNPEILDFPEHQLSQLLASVGAEKDAELDLGSAAVAWLLNSPDTIPYPRMLLL